MTEQFIQYPARLDGALAAVHSSALLHDGILTDVSTLTGAEWDGVSIYRSISVFVIYQPQLAGGSVELLPAWRQGPAAYYHQDTYLDRTTNTRYPDAVKTDPTPGTDLFRWVGRLRNPGGLDRLAFYIREVGTPATPGILTLFCWAGG